MTFTDVLMQTISMRSFSSIWYWMALAAVWSSATHWVIGVPHDLIMRARRGKGDAPRHVVTMAGVNAARYGTIVDEGGALMVGGIAFVLSSVAVLGFGYGYEFLQALFLLLLPLAWVFALTLTAARRLGPLAAGGDAQLVCAALSRHRLKVQIIGVGAILITTLYGMVYNLALSQVIGF